MLFRSESVPASDQYSLGVVLYEMVTGHKPYTAETPAAVLLKQANEPLPRPREFVREIPESLEKILFKMLAKKPQDRYATLADLDFALETVRNPGNLERKKNNKRIAPKGMTDENSLTTDSILIQKKEGSLSNMRGSKKWRIAAIVGAVALISVLAIIFIPGLFGAGDTEKSLISRFGFVQNLFPTENKYSLGDSIVSEIDGMTMVYVPAGDFLMGSAEGEGNDDERPQHLVYLDAFWIDKTEVTNAMYEQCVDSGRCGLPEAKHSEEVFQYYGNDEYNNYPVINVTWYQAQDYCEWAGRSLPSEAQWEKAARGTDGMKYPWGNSSPHSNSGNYYQNVGDTYRVGSYPEGASPYGALDMAGNVSEWVADWYGRYSSGAISNPTGAATGNYKILKGGSWNHYAIHLRSALRTYYLASYANNEIGFRCALDVAENAISQNHIADFIELTSSNTDSIANLKTDISPTATLSPIDFKPENAIYLGELDPIEMSVGFGKYCYQTFCFSEPRDNIVLGGTFGHDNVAYNKGIFAHAPSKIVFSLKNSYQRLHTYYMLETKCVSPDGTIFRIFADDQEVFTSDPIYTSSLPKEIEINLDNVETLTLMTDPIASNKDCDWSVWGNPYLVYKNQ